MSFGYYLKKSFQDLWGIFFSSILNWARQFQSSTTTAKVKNKENNIFIKTIMIKQIIERLLCIHRLWYVGDSVYFLNLCMLCLVESINSRWQNNCSLQQIQILLYISKNCLALFVLENCLSHVDPSWLGVVGQTHIIVSKKSLFQIKII